MNNELVSLKQLEGKYILILGVDCLRNATQTELLSKLLMNLGLEVECVHSPIDFNGTPTGQFLNNYIYDSAFRAKNPKTDIEMIELHHKHESEIQDYVSIATKAHITVIKNHGYPSNVAHGLEKGFNLSMLSVLGHSLKVPDITILFTGRIRDEEFKSGHLYEDDDAKVLKRRQSFLELLARYSCDNRHFGNWIVIDKDGTVDEVQQVLQKRLIDSISHIDKLPWTRPRREEVTI